MGHNKNLIETGNCTAVHEKPPAPKVECSHSQSKNLE